MKNYDNIDWKKLAKEYLETGISLTKMSEKYEISRSILTNRFKKLGVEIVNRQNEVKFDESVFDLIDSEEKAYWLGFIYADGYIDANKFIFEISLKGSDKEHLEKFNKFMKHKDKNHVKISNSKCGDKCFERCRWYVSNKHLWNILNSYGCTPNKSLTLEFPNFLIFKYDHLIRHFIRGYFDGDGSIWDGKRKKMMVKNERKPDEYRERIVHNVKFNFTGSDTFIPELQNYLVNRYGFTKTKLNYSKAKDSHKHCTMEYSGRKNVHKLYELMYSSATIYGERKKAKFEKILCALSEKSLSEMGLIAGTPEMAISSEAGIPERSTTIPEMEVGGSPSKCPTLSE